MLTIGLTGGIGCGKTTAAQFFQELGITIIDADIIAHELIAVATPAYTKILEHFGTTILNADNSINRKKLREIIFTDTEQRLWLEQLLHPLILQEIAARQKTIDVPYCILMIPLLLEKNVYRDIDRILVVDAPEDLQIQRVQQRDRLTVEQVKTILAAQLPRQQKLRLADDIIQNHGRLRSLRKQVLALHQKYLKLT